MRTLVLVLTITTATIGHAQKSQTLNKVWTYHSFEKVDKVGLIGGMDAFRVLDFTQKEILLLKGISGKVDTARYWLDNDLILIQSINQIKTDPNNPQQMIIRITKLKSDALDLLFTLSTRGQQTGAFKLKYRAAKLTTTNVESNP
jgi:hypothetical protein